MKLRNYQHECIEALYKHLYTEKTNPLCVLATGSGKSVIIAQFIKATIQRHPETRVICCIDTKELIDQNYKTLVGLWHFAPAGIYSAGLKRKQSKHQILFTGIQSVYNKADLIGHTDILIIDECHMSNTNIGSMWDTFIKELNPSRIIGFTATPYRNDCGLIYTGEDALYSGVAYEYTVKQGIKDGYLSSIIPKTMTTRFDVSQVKSSNGDFAESGLQEVVNTEGNNVSVIKEIVKYGVDRQGWLIFSSGCQHAHELDKLLKGYGYEGAVILGDTPAKERDKYIIDFKAKKLRYLVNNAVLTKGFDAPHIDLIAAVRPTQSPVLWAQMMGRALRVCEDKENALLLDFAENIHRFGFVDEMVFSDKKSSKEEEGVPPVKTCPECDTIVHAALSACPSCHYEFPKNKPRIEKEAYGGAVLSTQVVPEWKDVVDMYVYSYKSRKPVPTLRIEYVCANFERYYEYICFSHEPGSFPRNKAIKWWKSNANGRLIRDEALAQFYISLDLMPKTVEDAEKLECCVIKPSKIRVIQDGKFWRVLERDNSPPPPVCQTEAKNNGEIDFEEFS